VSQWKEKLEINNIPEQYRPLAELIGVQQLLALSEEYGGANLYIPKTEALVRATRDNLIKQQYNGYNAEELAKVYNLTVRWVQDIVKDCPHPDQITLFDFAETRTGTG
jgi:Mor family transcriptional regulator